MARPKKIKKPIPALTLCVIVVSIIVYGLPRFSDWLVYDRQAILAGQLWRLFTAPLVHFSASHMFWDTLVFGAAGWAIEASRYRGFWQVCLWAAVGPSLIFLLTLPALERYGGLSGLATGAVAYFCLCRALKAKKNRMIWISLLAAVGAKILAETAMGFPLFAQTGGIPFRVLPAAHGIGYLGAFAAAIRFGVECHETHSNLKI